MNPYDAADIVGEHALWLAHWPALCRLARWLGLRFVGVSRAEMVDRIMAQVRHSRRMHERSRTLGRESLHG